ncbi:uncharacterized protein LOC103717690 isoform X2 [Phoenix dactylifera]|uniref:Uncharacterized protein LOC103717690 isoform X2 n=1 Tax=Phoenix dactylifera TaxID=42345 RepID=A0A8B7CQQ8_PHODC|nr:uncharacterized protein LOC103717690 isoform X2 [Phoenix dactylifera]
MAPLPPPTTTTTTTYYTHSSSLRRRQGERAGEGRGGGARRPPPPPQRSASFHGRTAAAAASPVEHRQMRRPKTQPDLRAGGRNGTTASGGASPEAKMQGKGGDRIFEAAERRMPEKVLVNVTVQRSLGPVQVMVSTEWSIGDLVAAAARQYAKEGRRPPLSTTDPSAFGLHYSQFSLESLDPKEKLSGLGSRNFFLCLKSVPGNSDPATASSSAAPSSCAEQAQESKISIPWLS